MIPPAGRILGIDWGEVRIGIALSDDTQALATPLQTLTRRPGKRFPMGRLLDLISVHAPVGVVVGLPLTLEGHEEASAGAARELAEAIAQRTGLALELWDERLSTARALATVRAQGGSTRGRKSDVDALAAAVLLQHFLDARRNQRPGADVAGETDRADTMERR
ncbi:MAG TPA: Holliday junction resolvase RuvX [Gemmatimonadales bacterium]|nr:Holliday junction resolvase RuvX [Gemmatimonadales bacterium]